MNNMKNILKKNISDIIRKFNRDYGINNEIDNSVIYLKIKLGRYQDNNVFFIYYKYKPEAKVVRVQWVLGEEYPELISCKHSEKEALDQIVALNISMIKEKEDFTEIMKGLEGNYDESTRLFLESCFYGFNNRY